ncbi:protein YLS3-like [Papaver somniferum]|uniref:protein YLS3-like n=1 Tax=Papaver somniferum TaxID=3469 RepID=UPI000E6F5B99|nr:protein YLS3-like [Papaver somniferum]
MAIGMVLMKCMFMMVLSVGFVKSDIDKDREECTTQLVAAAPCLPYVGGTAKAPTPDCCTGFKQVLTTSKKCLCIVIKDRNDPSLGLKINATLALGLPAICKTNYRSSECPALLHLPPNSPDAKVFEDFNKIANGTTTATPPAAASKETPKSGSSNAGGSSPPPKNNGGMKLNSWLGLKMVGGVLLWCCLTSYY